MVKVLNPKRHNMIVEKTEEIPIIEQKRFLEDLIEGNMPEVRELASKTDEEQYKIAQEYLSPNPFEDFSGLTDAEINNLKVGSFFTYLDFSGLASAWDLRDEPKSIRDRAVYLSLRGIRKGHLDFMSMLGITNPLSERLGDFCFSERKYEIAERRSKKTGKICDPIAEQIKKEFLKDPVLIDYFSKGGYSLIFDVICSNLAKHISNEYGRNFLEE